MSVPASETPGELLRRIDAALAARVPLAARPLRRSVEALAAAAARWCRDGELAAALPHTTGLSAPMVAAALPLIAEALDAAAILELLERELGPHAADRPRPAGPALIAHVLASNVPGLALPAIALGCLSGAAVLVKSGRDDPCSASAFVRALAAVDPELAATVVCTYWPGGDREREDAALGRADIVVLTGGAGAAAALGGRLPGRLIVHGPRVSVAALGREALASAESAADSLALDIALYDQRGCLSPHVVYVETGGILAPRGFAERLAAALDRLAARLPPGRARIEDHARTGLARAEAEWEGTAVLAGPGGTVFYEEAAAFRPTHAPRSVRVHPLPEVGELPVRLPRDAIECVGLAAPPDASLVAALAARGVARVCALGRMQRPPLVWPRGQQAPLAALLGRPATTGCEVEPWATT